MPERLSALRPLTFLIFQRPSVYVGVALTMGGLVAVLPQLASPLLVSINTAALFASRRDRSGGGGSLAG